MTHFFFDRNLPVALARMLGHYPIGATITYLDDRFERTAPDSEWLLAIAEWDPIPVVMSGDGRILRNPAEAQVLRGLPISFFLFASGWFKLPWREFAWKAVKIWPEVVAAAAPRQPTVFRIPVSAQRIETVGLTKEIGAARRGR